MQSLMIVASGGALGAVLRLLSGKAVHGLMGHGFPYGTMVVNTVGSFIMGLAAVLILEKSGDQRLGLFLMTGVLGGFTTFSAFSLDTLALIEKGRILASGLYIGGSVGASILSLVLGLFIARSLWT